MYCDHDNNGYLDKCEIFDCVERVENQWRDDNCPCYGYTHCGMPYDCKPCEGMWDCEMAEENAICITGTHDTNFDMILNPEDAMDEEHY
jgi:hypothetical protein